MTVFGTFLDASDVEAAMLAHLRSWAPSYVAEVVRQKQEREPGIWPNGVAPIRNFTVVHAAEEKWPEDQLPMILAYSPGLLEPPVAHGDGLVAAKYQCAISAIASGRKMSETKALARVYATAAKGAILQHESLGGFATGVEWIDERNFPITQGVEAERNLMAVSAMYVVEVEALLDRNAGPLEPPEEGEEPADWPTVKEGGGKAAVVPVGPDDDFEDVPPEEGF